MIQLFFILSISGSLLILPGIFLCKNKYIFNYVLLSFPAIGIAMWFYLASIGLGAQSLSNLVELFAIVAVSIIVSYTKLFFFKDAGIKNRANLIITFFILLSAVIFLRAFTPALPE